MPLPVPILDDRSYLQLRDELVRRIPVYAPEWTDHNASDPGITLIELFAFLGENLLYRFNQIPEATRLAFLHLLGIPLRKAVPARAMIAVSLTDPEPGGTLITAPNEVTAGATPFETCTEVVVQPLEAVAVARVASPAPSGDAADFAAAAITAIGGLTANQSAAYYLSTLLPADPSAPRATAVDFSTTVDDTLWLAVLHLPSSDATLGSRMRNALTDQIVNFGFVPDLDVATDIEACLGAVPTDSGPEMIWEISTGTIGSDGRPRYAPVAVVGDTTRGLSQQGVLRLELPHEPADVFAPSDSYLLGTGDYPPELDDDDQASRLLFWIRGTRRDATAPLGRILYVGINGTDVIQTRTANVEFLGTGTGNADQTYSLVHQDVVEGSPRLQVEEASGWTDWQSVDGFEASTESSREYVLDAEAGTVRFGNGVRGRAPQIGERIRVTTYSYGGGAAGNVAPNAIKTLTAFPQLKVANPLPARGGADAESIADALDRVPGEIRRRDRAVTQSDFRELALATPGAGVGRAECIPLFYPPTQQLDAAGVVTVVVWPREDRKHPSAPVPDRLLIKDVCTWLDARRLVTTELYVIAPTYVPIAVAVGVAIKPGYGVEAVRRWVELVVRQYLAPLPPYGPDGQGWPLGRQVYGPELEAAALQVEGVAYLEGLEVAWLDGTTWQTAPHTPILLQPWEVPELRTITVVQGPPLPPGMAVTPTNVGGTDGTGTGAGGSGTTPVPVPIPTLKQEC